MISAVQISGIVLVSGKPYKHKDLNALTIADEMSNAGFLARLYTGLKSSKNDLTVIPSCGLPLMDKKFIKQLIDSIKNDEQARLCEAKEFLKRILLRMINFLNQLNRVGLHKHKAEDAIHLKNINTDKELKQLI